MAETHVITALVNRRARLAGDIENTKGTLKSLVDDLEKMDAVILMFDPDYRITGIKPKCFRPPEDWASRGEMSRIVIDTLRQAREPLTARDLAIGLMERRGMDKDDSTLLRKMTKRVGGALRIARSKGLTKASQSTGQFMVWALSR